MKQEFVPLISSGGDPSRGEDPKRYILTLTTNNKVTGKKSKENKKKKVTAAVHSNLELKDTAVKKHQKPGSLQVAAQVL
jgi:hypothetical protein